MSDQKEKIEITDNDGNVVEDDLRTNAEIAADKGDGESKPFDCSKCSDSKVCPNCGGSNECPTCSATGIVRGDECAACDGDGECHACDGSGECARCA